MTWREKYKIVFVIVTNVTEKYSNIRPSEVDNIKKKKKKKWSILKNFSLFV